MTSESQDHRDHILTQNNKFHIDWGHTSDNLPYDNCYGTIQNYVST